jgi:AraC-like DNA-binding protein
VAAIHDVRERRPGAALAAYAACVWVQDVSPASSAFTHRAAPTGSVELVHALGSTARIVGPQTGPLASELAPGASIAGVRLRPEAAAALLGLPASELVDVSLDVEDLWGHAGAALNERLAGASSAERAATLLEQALMRRRAPVDAVVAAATSRLIAEPRIDINAVAAAVCISERQLRRRFEAAAGLTPKTLQRILRFQRFLALAWANAQTKPDVARLAVEAGYVDQAHLGREAARLEGRSPRRFLAESAQRCGCGHDHRASYGPLLPAAR